MHAVHWLLHCINLDVCPEIVYIHISVFLPVYKKFLEIVKYFIEL